MDAHEALLLAHVLLLVYWLGTDLGVFYVSYAVTDRSLAPETRGRMARALVALDLSPRICLVLMLPVGLTLAADLGLSPVQGRWLALAWVAAVVWLAVVLTVHRTHSVTLARADGAFRALLAAVLVVTGAASIPGAGPFTPGWLGVKVALFGVAIGCGLGIRLLLRPFGPALATVVGGRGTDADEAVVARALGRTRPLVLVIWGVLVVSAALGIAQP